MLERIYLCLEAFSIVLCLSYLYGEKFRLDIKTVMFVAVDLLLMQTITAYNLDKRLSLIIYVVIVAYCILEYGIDIQKLVINILLTVIIIGILQIICAYLLVVLQLENINPNVRCLISNTIVLMFNILVIKNFKLNFVSKYLNQRDISIWAIIVFLIIMSTMLMIKYKDEEQMMTIINAVLFIMIVIICLISYKYQENKAKAMRAELQLQMHDMYDKAFAELLNDVRRKQHDFNNHLNAIMAQHYTCKTYDELVEAQSTYCRTLYEDNKYARLLSAGNSVIIGFLYAKFLNAEKNDIRIGYDVKVNQLECRVPVYNIIELVGNLIDNAVDALIAGNNERLLHVAIKENASEVEIIVRNVSDYIPFNDIQSFFQKGVSTKGDNRGLGLYNVSGICRRYQCRLICENRTIEGCNWLVFSINIPK